MIKIKKYTARKGLFSSLKHFFIYTILLTCASCDTAPSDIQFISISYPAGESDLRIWGDGTARLYYGAHPEGRRIKAGVFDIDEVYASLKDRLHKNVPRQEWAHPHAQFGHILIKSTKRGEQDYLIFDSEDLTRELFKKARTNTLTTSSF